MGELKRKLIEVALPLEAINKESARENYIYRGNPSSVHKWWAQRPLAAARAVLFAQLVDDPSARPDEFPTEEDQRRERERLHGLIERLVRWENVRDEKLLAEAHAEILKSTDGNPPPILDPFAGGGTIPLEAQRLGLEAHASDLNPVAVLINKALIEIPPKFRDQAPSYPDLADSEIRDWKGAEGLAADVRAYGGWMRDEAEKWTGHLYPKATLDDGTQANVIAWIWARTVTCPNPACGIEMPLVRSWWLGKKRGKEAYVVPTVVGDPDHPSGQRVQFDIGHDKAGSPTKETDGTVGRNGAFCIACETAVDLKYVRAEGRDGRTGQTLMAVVAEGNRSRAYVAPDQVHSLAADVPRPDDLPDPSIPDQALGFRVQAYGMTKWVNLFTNRQLVALTTFSDLVSEAREKVRADGGTPEYADAVATYLAFSVSKLADYGNSLAVWYPKEDRPKNLFARQSIPMVWDFPEVNPLCDIGGSWSRCVQVVSQGFAELVPATSGVAQQADASARSYLGAVVNTDPPYYDNIGYSDLSDFFYVWLRRALRKQYPDLLSTMLVPKAEELVANQYRHGGKSAANGFFESGFRRVFAKVRESAATHAPMVVWYAFKQSEKSDAGETSSGWETLLEGMIRSNWEITSTWPVRSERSSRAVGLGTNALASSIVLSLRPRAEDARTTDRRGFIATLEAELPDALRKLQQGLIAPVDLPQAAIGPGMAVFSRYSAVLEPDGTKMTVRAALSRINEILDQVLNEQEGDFHATTRFALAWYRQHGYAVGDFGDANTLANARNTSVDAMARAGVLTSAAGKVQLIRPEDMPADYDVLADESTSGWEVLHHLIRLLNTGGVQAAGSFLATALSRPEGDIEADLIKELAHLVFRVSEKNGWTKEALDCNTVVTSWPEILDASREVGKATSEQGEIDFDEVTES
ncbi:DUF1156 domain-containing protein [Ornithinicoccus hortensis]|uniref:DUF1156 domain-containing protein n=1 Tax=Ornithinicoccus hortensis TaxID=82346 RepID=UPI00114EF957|nr:DUF1156 domain-containing protein [Ornithinicoccus hortensis]